MISIAAIPCGKTWNKLALLAPYSARMQQLIAERLINAGDLKGAIEHYHKVIALDPGLPGMYFELAEAALESSNSAEAQTEARLELEAAIKTDGHSARAECALGRIDRLQNKRDDAYAHYRLARVCHSLHLGEEEPKEIKLYQEIREKKNRIGQLYRQMNRRLEGQDDQPAGEKQ